MQGSRALGNGASSKPLHWLRGTPGRCGPKRRHNGGQRRREVLQCSRAPGALRKASPDRPAPPPPPRAVRPRALKRTQGQIGRPASPRNARAERPGPQEDVLEEILNPGQVWFAQRVDPWTLRRRCSAEAGDRPVQSEPRPKELGSKVVSSTAAPAVSPAHWRRAMARRSPSS